MVVSTLPSGTRGRLAGCSTQFGGIESPPAHGSAVPKRGPPEQADTANRTVSEPRMLIVASEWAELAQRSGNRRPRTAAGVEGRPLGASDRTRSSRPCRSADGWPSIRPREGSGWCAECVRLQIRWLKQGWGARSFARTKWSPTHSLPGVAARFMPASLSARASSGIRPRRRGVLQPHAGGRLRRQLPRPD